jgi:hypothetical protein
VGLEGRLQVSLPVVHALRLHVPEHRQQPGRQATGTVD